MSLYRFFETNIQENPELLLLSQSNPSKSHDLYQYFLTKQRKSLFQSFTDILLNDTLTRCAKTPIEYEILKLKTRRLANKIEVAFTNQKNSAIN